MWALLACTAILGIAVWPALNTNRILDDWGRRRRARSEPKPPPPGRPIADIAADCRRLRAALLTVPAGTAAAKRDGLGAAYDDALIEACAALGISTALSGDHDHDHDRRTRLAARSITERRLDEAGLLP